VEVGKPVKDIRGKEIYCGNYVKYTYGLSPKILVSQVIELHPHRKTPNRGFDDDVAVFDKRLGRILRHARLVEVMTKEQVLLWKLEN
jgi:hypothetical protein